jgi:hypothetical protein
MLSKDLKSVVVINLFGGPGVGKSTNAARIFSELKESGVNCELVQEYAKRKTWEKNHVALADQFLVFGKQRHAMITAAQDVDMIITDSPLVLGIIYDKTGNSLLHHLIYQEHCAFHNLNFRLNRVKPYQSAGRNQTEDEAKEKDVEVDTLLSVMKQRGESVIEVDGAWPYTQAIIDAALIALASIKGFSIKSEPYPFPLPPSE